MTAGSSFVIMKQNALSEKLIQKKGESIANIVAEIAYDPVFYKDIKGLDTIAKNVLRDKDILFVFFLDKDRHLLNSFANSLSIPSEEFDEWGIIPDDNDITLQNLIENNLLIHFEKDIVSGKKAIGTLVFGINRSDHSEESTSFLFLMIFTTLFVIIIMGALIYILFNRLVYRPLRAIIDTSKEISSGNLNINLDISSHDEIAQVSRSINHLSLNLREIITSIKELFSDIEESSIDINNRTDSIKSAVNEQSALVQEITSVIEQNNDALNEISLQTDDFKSSSEDTSASILELVSSSNEIANNMDTLFEEIEQSTSSLQQISASLNSLIDAVNIVTSAVEDASSSSEEINISIKEIEKLSQKGNEMTKGIRDHTENTGIQSINKTIEGMKKVKDSVELAGEVISILDSKSNDINKILQVIDEVTDRTTLLSLNASILAAQAGSQGKAFAVVAGEIKTLANDTSSSTQEISGIIDMIRKEIKTAVLSMGEGMNKVSEGLALAEETGRVFGEITFLNQTSSDMSAKIENATVEQATGVEIVVKAVRSIEERITHLSTVVRQQKEGMDTMLLSIERMRDIARQVKKSTDEQRRASSQISSSAESISNMSAAIAISMKLTSDSSAGIVSSLEMIKKNTDSSNSMVLEMSHIVSNLLNKAQNLRNTINKFRS